LAQNTGESPEECWKFSTGSTECNIFFFYLNPYAVLEFAQVCRRDSLNRNSWADSLTYQREIHKKKIDEIRNALINTSNFLPFTFPSSVFVVLNDNCNYDRAAGTLEIPNTYGSIQIIDGQHRVLAYAHDSIESRFKNSATIAVTAIQFENLNEEDIRKNSARLFVEINTNQTKVNPLLLYDIEYDILDKRTPKAISAKILITINQDRRKKIAGLLQTNSTPDGIIKISELISSLSQILNYQKRIAPNLEATSLTSKRLISGYINLVCQDSQIKDLIDGSIMMDHFKIAISRYFEYILSTFNGDLEGLSNSKTGLKRTKMFCGFIKLFKYFIDQGYDWEKVRNSLFKINENVGKLDKRKNPLIIFDEQLKQIPNPDHKQRDYYNFLKANISRKTSIQSILN
jgi:DGQHR domain-containing protein